MAETIELKEGDVIVDKDELARLMQQLDDLRAKGATAETRIQMQTVLINQAVRVVNEIEKVVPGLFSGRGLEGVNIMDLLSGEKIKHLGPDCEKLKKLMDEYKSKYPILVVA
jgi:translation elongation factor P/translation initiation factor 5A